MTFCVIPWTVIVMPAQAGIHAFVLRPEGVGGRHAPTMTV